jgi:hypothetical protein
VSGNAALCEHTFRRLYRKLRAGDVVKFVSEIVHEDVED